MFRKNALCGRVKKFFKHKTGYVVASEDTIVLTKSGTRLVTAGSRIDVSDLNYKIVD